MAASHPEWPDQYNNIYLCVVAVLHLASEVEGGRGLEVNEDNRLMDMS